MCTINGFSQSTYRSSYLGERPTIPLIKYKNLPCLYFYANLPKPPDSTSSSTVVPLTRACKPVPHPPQSSNQDTVINLNLASPRSPKHNGTPNRMVFDTKFGPMDSAMIDALYKKRRYSTSTQVAAQECALPIAKVEPLKPTEKLRADMVRFRAQRYDAKADDWQDAVLWDRVQSRPITQGYGNMTSDTKLPIPPSDREVHTDKKLLHLRKNAQIKQNNIRNLVKCDGLANVFVRKCPGYAGYAPLCPPETRLDDQNEVNTLMTSSYKIKNSNLTEGLDTGPNHGRKAPFSQTVTLTSPLNPYNKVGQEGVKVDKESRYLNMKEYLSVLPY